MQTQFKSRTFQLPKHLDERVREIKPGKFDGKFVLYWMQTAMRIEENPALDVARLFAENLDLPLLIYQGLSERYLYASDRHHQFILEGVCDLQSQCMRANLDYVFFLETQKDKRPHLKRLANQAALVIVEDIPVDPPRKFLRALKRSTSQPILAIDTACIVPMQTVEKQYSRAFAFRDDTRKKFAERIGMDWPELELNNRRFDPRKLDFQPLTVLPESIGDLIGECKIDHLVPPVFSIQGGTKSGYQRWNEFLKKGIKTYAKKRNDPLLKGTSRLSPYLHYGMISPFRIAREAHAIEGPGSEKFLDEFLIWRELAFNLCYHRLDHDHWSVLPEWASDSLRQHSTDHRHKTFSWEQLCRGETDNEFWNICQKSLLQTGELHNNLRMTWGKALINWTIEPQDALKLLTDLNNRFALDGRDPCSFGGILWCFGMFDRPFLPERPITGKIRERPVEHHASRFDIQKFHKNFSRPKYRVAIIGAGISGLIAARNFLDHGFEVTVFEKSRGIGGRMATRRTENGPFDHGAQYFTVRDKRFSRFVESWIEKGLVKQWPDPTPKTLLKIVTLQDGSIISESNSVKRYVPVPAMNAVCKSLANEISIKTQTRIDRVESSEDSFDLIAENGDCHGGFDGVITSAPAEQASSILKNWPDLAMRLGQIEMAPCWACMVTFAKPLDVSWAGAFLKDSFLSWTSRNSTKPGRNCDLENIVIHASPEWTHLHWDDPPEEVQNLILDEFWRVTGCNSQPHQAATCHRWKYALPQSASNSQCFFDESSRLIACGDWASGSRVEGAFLSGIAAFGRMYHALSSKTKTPPAQKHLF